MDLASRAAERPVVLDGGLATLLEARGHDLSDRLWSARLLLEDPDAIERAHAEFFAAGAEVATSASYQASFAGFAAAGIDRDEAERLIRLSVALARRARDRVRPDGWVAASVGPYGAVLADGSEYRGDDGLSVAALRAFHRPRMALLAESGADVLAIETLPRLAEVEAVLAELAGTGHPAWLSLTAAGDRTRAGEPLAEAFAMAREVPEVIGYGVNCLAPGDVAPAVRAGASVVYPNSGQGWDARDRRWTGESAFDPETVAGWVHDGARLVGGCCRVGPEEIAAVSAVLAG